jgi:hypothetical protein
MASRTEGKESKMAENGLCEPRDESYKRTTPWVKTIRRETGLIEHICERRMHAC